MRLAGVSHLGAHAYARDRPYPRMRFGLAGVQKAAALRGRRREAPGSRSLRVTTVARGARRSRGHGERAALCLANRSSGRGVCEVRKPRTCPGTPPPLPHLPLRAGTLGPARCGRCCPVCGVEGPEGAAARPPLGEETRGGAHGPCTRARSRLRVVVPGGGRGLEGGSGPGANLPTLSAVPRPACLSPLPLRNSVLAAGWNQ